MKRNQKTPSLTDSARTGFHAFPAFRICFGFRISDFGFPARLAVLLLLTTSLRAGDILGYTEPYRIITVSAAEPGVIAEMLVEEGSVVKKGQILARLDTATLHAELDIAKAETKLQATRKQRLDELASASRASPEELEKARTDLTIKEAQVRKIEAMIETRLMRSAVDGVVTTIKRDPSEAVSAADPHVLTVVQIDKLTANLFLPPAKACQLKAGGQAALLLDDRERVDAIIEFISPVTDAASGTVRVKFTIENADNSHRSGARCALAE
jgi:RND family efflux transporter MFP subunit